MARWWKYAFLTSKYRNAFVRIIGTHVILWLLKFFVNVIFLVKKKKGMNANEILVFLSFRGKKVKMISFIPSGIGYSFSIFTLISVKNDYCYSFFLQRLYHRDNRHFFLPYSLLYPD